MVTASLCLVPKGDSRGGEWIQTQSLLLETIFVDYFCLNNLLILGTFARSWTEGIINNGGTKKEPEVLPTRLKGKLLVNINHASL